MRAHAGLPSIWTHAPSLMSTTSADSGRASAPGGSAPPPRHPWRAAAQPASERRDVRGATRRMRSLIVPVRPWCSGNAGRANGVRAARVPRVATARAGEGPGGALVDRERDGAVHDQRVACLLLEQVCEEALHEPFAAGRQCRRTRIRVRLCESSSIRSIHGRRPNVMSGLPAGWKRRRPRVARPPPACRRRPRSRALLDTAG